MELTPDLDFLNLALLIARCLPSCAGVPAMAGPAHPLDGCLIAFAIFPAQTNCSITEPACLLCWFWSAGVYNRRSSVPLLLQTRKRLNRK